MQNKQILLTALLATNINPGAIFSLENKNTSLVVSSESITKKDIEKLATKEDFNKLLKPVKRKKWFAIGAITGAALTCVLREHKGKIKDNLQQSLEIISKNLETIVNRLKDQPTTDNK